MLLFIATHNKRISKICNITVIAPVAPVAHLVVHQAVTREVVSSRLRPDQHSGSLNKRGESAAFVISSANG